MATKTQWWHTEDDVVACDLCPRGCRLHEGQRAFCFVRQNVGGEMVLTTYGKSTGFCIDPIEKKPLNHFLPGTSVLSFGTAGCNLGCKFCQNWDISKSREIERLSDSASPEAIARAAQKHGCRSVAFTYNDPVIWAEYAIDTAKACHDLGLKTVAVTAGYIQPEAREDFYAVMDAANVDLKAFTETFYKKLTFSHLGPVLDTLRWLRFDSDVWFEITNLVIPQENDSPDEIAKMCDWIIENLGDDVPVHFTAFHPDFKLRDRPPTPHATLVRARQQALDAGLKFVYVGNVNDVERQSTYCPSCKTLLIERDWYELGQYQMQGDRCGKCGRAIPGVFEEGRGDWGRRRVPIEIQEPVLTTLIIDPPKSPPGATRTGPRVDFREDDVEAIVEHARVAAESAVCGTAPPTLPAGLAESPTYGVFVTLKRATLLRACRGRWGNSSTLQELLTQSARDAAVDDPRFPSILANELPFLQLDVSLMFDPQPITVSGVARQRAIEIGKHGLVITHPRGRGLLLPHVATEAGWDALTFLEALCRKAGLSVDAWRDEAARLMTFQTRLFHSPAPVAELDMTAVDPAALDLLGAIAAAAVGEAALPAYARSAALAAVHPEDLAIYLQAFGGRNAVAFGSGRSLAALAQSAGKSLRANLAESARRAGAIERMTILWQPLPLVARDYPDRHQLLGQSAVLARADERWGLVMPHQQKQDPVAKALATVQLSPQQWREKNGAVAVTAFSQHVHQATAAPVRSVVGREEVRRPARAGQFYPADPQEIRTEVSRLLALGNGRPPRAYRAVMLPHAGWLYCGTVAGKTLGRTIVPRRVCVLSPRHTSYGSLWSVSPADWWELPGATVKVAADLRRRLLELAPWLDCEPEAHRYEHGIEVLVPFLLARNPEVQIVPIVVGGLEYDRAADLAQALATVADEQPEPVLFVISSDMNHFAPEPENRRLDYLAIDAMLTGNPRRLYQTVMEHRISMCGVMPAVTVMEALRRGGELSVELVDYTNSGQVSGDLSRVVGYAGVLLDRLS